MAKVDVDFFAETKYARYVDCLHDVDDDISVEELSVLIAERVSNYVKVIDDEKAKAAIEFEKAQKELEEQSLLEKENNLLQDLLTGKANT